MSTHVEGSVVAPRLALVQLLYQQWRSPAIHVATRLGIAEVLADGSLTVAELAEATGANAGSLYRLLRA
ncbi:MAG: methyltransferase family protein, partial [Pseudonocardiaceae bacterium]